MKIRAPRRKRSIAAVPSSKVDPTRTQTLRRQYAAELGKAFARLGFDVARLVVDEDVFGLAASSGSIADLMRERPVTYRPVDNVFCATGPGGGIDPTCSPGGKTPLQLPLGGSGNIFHGTLAETVDSILREGLKVGRENDEGRPASVYFNTNRVETNLYARTRASLMKMMTKKEVDFAVIEIDLPKALRERSKPDEEDQLQGNLNSWRVESNIPPEAVKAVHYFDKKTGRWSEESNPRYQTQNQRLGTREAYAAIFCVYRQTHNTFCPTGKGGRVDPTCGKGMGKAATVRSGFVARAGSVTASLKKAGARAAHLEHAAKAYARDKIATAVNKLPPRIGRAVKSAYFVARAGTKVAFASWTAGQALAERVAKERGATAEQARRLRGVLSAIDVTAMKPIQLGLGAGGAGAAALPVSFLPPASAAYLAYSTARNPIKTLRAARNLVRDQVRETVGRFSRNQLTLNLPSEGPAKIADALEAHDYDDWYITLFSAALDQTEDVFEAIKVADAAYRKSPKAPEGPREARQTDNTFCPTGPGGGVDPTCGKGGRKKSKPSAKSVREGITSGRTLAEFEREHKSDEEEIAIVIDPGGINQRPSVRIYKGSRDELELPTTGMIGTTVSHNHPDGDSFSTKDIMLMAALGIKELRAFTPEGKVYSMKLAETIIDGKPSGVRLYPGFGTVRDRISKVITDVVTPEEMKLSRSEQKDRGLYSRVWKEFSARPFKDKTGLGKERIIKYEYSEESLAANTRWKFLPNTTKIEAFDQWLRGQIETRITARQQQDLIAKYTKAAYDRGARRAYEDTNKGVRTEEKDILKFQGGKDQHVRALGVKQESAERVKGLIQRSISDLEGVTEAMRTKMLRTLADGLDRGLGAKEVARNLVKDVKGIGKARAELIARTEIIRAHAEGQLDSMEALGVEEVDAAVEWRTTVGACPLCAPLNGVVLKLREARGLIPRHPRCKCSWRPAVGPKQPGQKRGKYTIDQAIGTSEYRSSPNDDWGLAVPISRKRPTANVFCPTGQGGGVDPTCSPGSSSARSAPIRIPREAAMSAPQADVEKVIRGVQRIGGENNFTTIYKVRKAAHKIGWTDERFDAAITKARMEGKVSFHPNEFGRISRKEETSGFINPDPDSTPFVHVSYRG